MGICQIKGEWKLVPVGRTTYTKIENREELGSLDKLEAPNGLEEVVGGGRWRC